jgi:hypothetical protein
VVEAVRVELRFSVERLDDGPNLNEYILNEYVNVKALIQYRYVCS